MTLQEFSIEFDLLYNNISSNQAPGLTEYEKSVFLTQAQETLVLDLYKGTAGDSFETTEEVTRYLSSLVKTETLPSVYDLSKPLINGIISTNFILPEDLLFITMQYGEITLDDDSTKKVIVVPSTQDSLYNTLNNPFKGPNSNRVISISEKGMLTIYSKHSISSLDIKYLSMPNPIILETIKTEGLTIKGHTEAEEVTWLPESLHMQILLRAVQMAKAVWQS